MASELVVDGGRQLAAPSGQVDVQSLMALAVEKGVDGVEALERLVALQERLADRSAREQFFEALNRFQDECPVIVHDSKVDFTGKSSGTQVKYSYASLPHIWEVVKPLLQKHGFSVSWDTDESGPKMAIKCILYHRAGHSREATFTAPVTSASPGMSDQQKAGGALTYGRRQTLVSVLGLVAAESDNDGANEREIEAITEDQALDLQSIAEELKVDKAVFLKVLGAESFNGIPKAKLGEANALLDRKKKERERKGQP